MRTAHDMSEGDSEFEHTEDLGEYTTIIVRVRRDDAGRLSGVVERVRTGEKVRFHGLETLGRAVATLLESAQGDHP
ncbi:MAG TPA: hypothetical protein VJ277_00635 [Gemmatimonadales bacterium]|jgi:hypothetical protein|nr:hypothetical protein [Gemmatimonadales bacterium]